MKIRYLGHSCFVLTKSGGCSIVTDPYGDVGFCMPEISAHAVTASHSHYDHCNVEAVQGFSAVFDKAGEYSFENIKISALASWHDDARGLKRGENLIFKFRMDNLSICHLGDLGEPCNDVLLEKVGRVDVLLIPVGGNYTIDAAQAKEYVDRIRPSIVIPMHYMQRGLNIAISGPDDFLNRFYQRQIMKVGCEIELSEADISKSEPKIIVMERAL